VSPSYRKYRDAYSKDWVIRAYELAPPGFARLLEEEAKWICEHAVPPLLEIGCGAGRLLLAAGLDQAAVVGMDLVPLYLAAARLKLGRARLVAGDAFRPPFAGGSFATMVLAQATIGSVGGASIRKKMTAATGRLVAPHGLLLVTAYGPQARRARRAWPAFLTHFRREAAEVLVSTAFRPRCRRVVLEARRRRRLREKRRAGEQIRSRSRKGVRYAGWYVAQQGAGLLPPFNRVRSRGGRFVFTNGFVSEELDGASLQSLRPRGFDGEVRELPGGMLAAAWTRVNG